MPGTNSSAENSIVPSTLKWDCASGSRNSLKVVLKKLLYSSWSTCQRTAPLKFATKKSDEAEQQQGTRGSQAYLIALPSRSGYT